MKKLISLFLVVIFICSALVGCVNQDLESKMKEKYLSQFGIEDKTPEDVVIDYDAGTYNGARVLMLDAEWHDREEWAETIGETQIQYYDSNRLLVYAFGKFYTLEEAKKYYILSEESIIKIADDFQSQVTHYRDTCDVHDFEEYQFIDNFDIFDDYDPWTNVIAIDLDKRICRDNESFSIADYLGKDIIAGVKNIFDRNPKYNSYSLYICNPGYENMQYVFERLSKIPGVLHAGYYYSFFDLGAESSNDKYYTNYGAWGLEDIEIEKVWDFTTGSSIIQVGIIDSGISQHPDLVDNLAPWYSYNFINNSNVMDGDSVGHGTMVARVIGAVGNNRTGVCGVNWYVGLVAYKVYPVSGATSYADYIPFVANAINRAKYSYLSSSYPIKILNISLNDLTDNSNLKQAVDDYDGLIVYSAGNQNKNTDIFPHFPGFYGSDLYSGNQVDNIIVVGALQRDGNRWYDNSTSGSNYGDQTVDIYAPGNDIITTYPEAYNNNSDLPDGYIITGGTSFAAPYVSGVAALLLSIDPELTTEQLKDCILSGAETITITVGDNNDISKTVKKLNAWGALKYLFDNYYTHEIYYLNNSSLNFTNTIETNSSLSTFEGNTSFVKLNVQTSSDYVFNITSSYDMKVVLYDSNYEPIVERTTNGATGTNIDFVNYLSVGTYYLKSNIVDEIYDPTTVSVSINYRPHVHNHVVFVPYNSTMHKSQCPCGESEIIEPHAIKESDLLKPFANCMFCGQFIDLRNNIVITPGIYSTSKITVNGSYILPNGIIVLVDEDIESYENGTLVFYDKDKLPQTQ